MINQRSLIFAGLAAGAVALSLFAARLSAAADSIRIGDLNSYAGDPEIAAAYRNGWKLAVEQINAKGGVLGQPLEVFSRDDGGKPDDAVSAADELVSRNRVALLIGTERSPVGIAVADFAKQKKVLFVAAAPLSDALTGADGNRYTFRLRPPVSAQVAMLVEEAAKLPAKRWATVAPNSEYGKAAVAAFKALMAKKRPDIQWVAEQWPAPGTIDGEATAEALVAARPDAIFNATFGPDLVELVRDGNRAGAFHNRPVVSLLTGEPEQIDALRDDTPKGWIVTGYPWYAIETKQHAEFLEAYKAHYVDYPRFASVLGYATMNAVAAIIARAGSTDTDTMIAAAQGVEVNTPFGPISFRPTDRQSTMGMFVGRTTNNLGHGIIVDWHYADGALYPSDPDVASAARSGD